MPFSSQYKRDNKTKCAVYDYKEHMQYMSKFETLIDFHVVIFKLASRASDSPQKGCILLVNVNANWTTMNTPVCCRTANGNHGHVLLL